jgi:hypothetical protein
MKMRVSGSFVKDAGAPVAAAGARVTLDLSDGRTAP